MNAFNFRTLSFSLALAAMLGLAGSAMAAEPQRTDATARSHSGAGMMSLSPEKQEIVKKLHEDFYNNTKATRQELISKKHELDAQLYSAKPDDNKIQALTKEISDLRAKLYNARVTLKGKLIKENVMLGHSAGCCGGRSDCWSPGMRGGR
jgi:zinc resistance-associated protein